MYLYYMVRNKSSIKFDQGALIRVEFNILQNRVCLHTHNQILYHVQSVMRIGMWTDLGHHLCGQFHFLKWHESRYSTYYKITNNKLQ